jgi:hypothetical protein
MLTCFNKRGGCHLNIWPFANPILNTATLNYLIDLQLVGQIVFLQSTLCKSMIKLPFYDLPFEQPLL